MRYPEYVSRIIDRLEAHGFEAYIVGGSVRDMLIGKEPNDYDITTSALPERTLEIFSDMRTIPTGLKHGTVTVLSDSQPIEVTTFRVDGEYLDSRRPESVSFTSDVKADLSRRDFTINAMAYSEKRGLIDVFGGREDLNRRVIRAVGVPEERFSEDALRIMRAFRFSAQLGFDIEESTLAGAIKLREGLSRIAAERISVEFIRTICNSTPKTTLKLMADCEILEVAIGVREISESVLDSLERAAAKPHVRLGLLLSELEKDKEREILRSLKLSNKLVSDTLRISEGIKEELKGNSADARRFIGMRAELAPDILDASAAMGRCDPDFYKTVKEEMAKKSCSRGSDLAVNGGDIVKIGAKGREVGAILTYLLERVIEEPLLNERETLRALAVDELKRMNGEND